MPVLSCLLLAVVACGGSSSAAPADGAAAAQDAATQDAARDAAASDAAAPDAPATISDAPASTVVSNTPRAAVVDTGNPATPELVLLSSNLLQETVGTQTIQQWFGELENVGTTNLCFIEITASFQNATGAQLASFKTAVEGELYADTGAATPIPCLPPGHVGSFHGTASVPTAISLDAVIRIEIAIAHPDLGDLVPHPHMPDVSDHTAGVTGGFGVTGTLTGNVGPIYNIGLHIYPRDANGLVLGVLSASAPSTLAPDQVVSFTTTSVSTAFSQFRSFVSFLDGAGPAAAVSP